MKRIACFCIPAHGHTNPMLPVAAALVKRGNAVRFYSFDAFAERIRATGAEYISCDAFLPELNEKQKAGIMKVSTTEMSIQDIRTTLAMNGFLERELTAFRPDVIFTDSVCFWGKLNAWKFGIPMVVSTSTFAFNQLSSTYMKHSPGEMADMIAGLPRISRELRTLEPYGYHVKNTLSLVQSDNSTDSVVYTSARFQPFVESFSGNYAFVGPSVFSREEPRKNPSKPLVYIALGTVINDRPDFYARCLEALRDMDVEVIISCGQSMDPKSLGELPANAQVFPRVNQLEVLARASVFITHCGMNSVSESLWMAAPMALYPQTAEQIAVARRVREVGAGLPLADDSAEGIRRTVRELLEKPSFAEAARACSEDFRACSGPEGAAAFIESAPHTAPEPEMTAELRRANLAFQVVLRVAIALAVLIAGLAGLKPIWLWGVIAGVTAGIAVGPLGKRFQAKQYERIVRKKKKEPGTGA